MALKQQLGKLERVPVRDIWPNETSDFTPWLRENCDLLSDSLGLQVSELKNEVFLGNFWVDLVGTLADGNTIIIENQFGRSNHDHLGKLITYMAAMGATVAVWLMEEPRQEHVKAISWLNDSSPNDFYLLQFEAVKIFDSAPAPLITLIAGPSEVKKAVAVSKGDLTESHKLMQEFWGQLIAKLQHGGIQLYRGSGLPVSNWMTAAKGDGYSFWYVANARDAKVELSLGASDPERNRRLYTELESKTAEIEATLKGQSLEWTAPEGRPTARIVLRVADFGVSNKSRWPELQDKLIGAMQAFIKALQPHIDALKE